MSRSWEGFFTLLGGFLSALGRVGLLLVSLIGCFGMFFVLFLVCFLVMFFVAGGFLDKGPSTYLSKYFV